MRRRALEHRLLSMEKEVHENSLVLQSFLGSLEKRFSISEMVDLRDLKRECHDEAQAIVSKLAEEPAPPMPSFDSVEGFEENPSLVDEVGGVADDDIFMGRDPYGEEEEEGAGEALPPVLERSKTCKDWRITYGVSPGVSWGNLPYEMQQRWRNYDCDIFMQDSVQGMIRDQLEEPIDDDFEIVGDINSMRRR